MAIKILRTGLPVIGYAKIGEPTAKSSQMKGAPRKFDHVELTGTVRDENGALVPDKALMQRLIDGGVNTCGGCARSKAIGFPNGLPTQLGIYLPYDDLDLALPHRLAYYRSRTAFCVGDGEQAQRLTVAGKRKLPDGSETDTYGPAQPHSPCGPACADFQTRRCKPHAKLRFVLGIQQHVGGVYEFRTTSWNSIANLHESLTAIRVATGGLLQWIPLVFEVSPQTVQPANGGAANTAYIARVTFPGSPQDLLAAAQHQLQLRAPVVQQIRALEAQIRGETQWTETAEEVEEIQREFAAEPVEPAAVTVETQDVPEADPNAPASAQQLAALSRACADRALALLGRGASKADLAQAKKEIAAATRDALRIADGPPLAGQVDGLLAAIARAEMREGEGIVIADADPGSAAAEAEAFA